MSLSSTSNTINSLGIFGRMSTQDEQFFINLEKKFSDASLGYDDKQVFNHLSLVIAKNVPIGQLSIYLDLLRELKPHIPLTLKTKGVIIKDNMHVALTFNTTQTFKIRSIAEKLLDDSVVKTHYTKVVWYVPEQFHDEVVDRLSKLKVMVFTDFVLVANVQNTENTIYKSSKI